MWNPKTLATLFSLALVLTQFAGGKDQPVVPLPAPTAIVYEVSKSGRSGRDQEKLIEIFIAVRDSIDPSLTRDEFVRRLKAREHFEIRYPEKCRTCNGWKRLIPRSGDRGKDGKVNCKTCRGRGLELRPYIIKWDAAHITHKGDRRDSYLASLKRKLGDDASAQVWYTTARSYEHGERKGEPESRALAHAAYQEAVKRANLAWRDKEPADSDLNRLHRRIIDQSLAGIAATAPEREAKVEIREVTNQGEQKPPPSRSDGSD